MRTYRVYLTIMRGGYYVVWARNKTSAVKQAKQHWRNDPLHRGRYRYFRLAVDKIERLDRATVRTLRQ